MKFIVLLSVVLTSILFLSVFHIGTGHALNQNEASVSLSWSASVYYQGDSGTVAVTFVSNCPEELRLNWIGIHFDWQLSSYYFAIDLTSNPVGVASYGTYTFSAISFSVSSDVSVGSHSYYVYLTGTQHGLWWYDISWTSSTSLIYIHDAYEKVYYDSKPSTETKISNEASSFHLSPFASSMVNQAKDEYSLASSLAEQGKYQDACDHLNTAASLIDQAQAAENSFRQYLVIFVIALAAVIIAVFLIIRYRKKIKTSTKT